MPEPDPALSASVTLGELLDAAARDPVLRRDAAVKLYLVQARKTPEAFARLLPDLLRQLISERDAVTAALDKLSRQSAFLPQPPEDSE